MPNQSVAIDQKLVALGLAPKNRMIVEHQASLAFFSRLALKNKRRRQPADTSPNNHAIVNLAGVDRIRRSVLKQPIANLVSGLKHGPRISIRVRVVTHSAIAGPAILRGV